MSRASGSYRAQVPGRCSTKRLLDLLLVSLTWPLWLPLLAVIALALKLDGRTDSVFFGHRRIGLDGEYFTMWKFTSMVSDGDKLLQAYLQNSPQAQAELGRVHKVRRDPRVTRLGYYLRRYSLDELPQLWNVLRGDMSLVGPRPIAYDHEVKLWGEHFRLYKLARPGLTGPWGVSGRNELPYEERIRLDSDYVINWSLGQDLRLLLRTPVAVCTGRGAY
ncbi:MAG: sugar transferase [Candidatus Eremiobacteraeota bacterium]|nr:sugar transferase [Candidatus Eremiobacteraeota bacterium]